MTISREEKQDKISRERNQFTPHTIRWPAPQGGAMDLYPPLLYTQDLGNTSSSCQMSSHPMPFMPYLTNNKDEIRKIEGKGLFNC